MRQLIFLLAILFMLQGCGIVVLGLFAVDKVACFPIGSKQCPKQEDK